MKDSEIVRLLDGREKDILSNINILSDQYKKITGRVLNRGCSACINEMLITLKHHYNMTQFRLKGANRQFKNKQTDRVTISNSTMTDDKAVEFLKTNPKRIELFEKFPSNWKDLIEGKEETDEERNNRIAIEAEMKAKADAVKEAEPKALIIPEKEELLKMSMKDLRETFPLIKATSITDFIDKVEEMR